MRLSRFKSLNPSIFVARRALLAMLTATAVTVGLAAPAQAAPQPELWQRWTAHDAAAQASIDHSLWDRFLKNYVTVRSKDVNLVAYGQVTRADRAALEAYIGALEATPVSRFNRGEQLAYWVNLYNALTVRVILDNYPVEGIRDIDISPGWFADGPWEKKLVVIEGEEVSLDDIEHRILRPIWQDPRIHYAVNCASIGCPDLGTEAVTADNAESFLDAGARAYINSWRGAQVRSGKLYVSSLYSWFEADFDADGGVIPHLSKYADADLAKSLSRISTISGDDYDWRLNDATPRDRVAKTAGSSGSADSKFGHRNLRRGGS